MQGSERLRRVQEIWLEARSMNGPERARYIAEACGADTGLAEEVESLLRAGAGAGGFLEVPALGPVVPAMIDGQDSEGAPSVEDPLIGQLLGPWRIEARIGTGGMGAVYRARRDDGQFDQVVAVKVVKRGMDTEEIVARFRQERRTLAGLSHPNIARLLDGGVAPDGRPYLVIEYVRGSPIDEYCSQQRLSIADRVRLMIKVCEAVRIAHQSLVVHRDIKPGNIMVDERGEPKLMDFGIAKLIAGSEGTGTAGPGVTLTAAAERRLTPEYASPEQIAGRPVTTATDVYSLGVVLYELLTGQRPYRFETRTTGEFERVVCTVDPPAPSAAAGRRREDHLRRELRGDLDAIVLTALAKDPARRYGSAEALSADLSRYLDGLPVSARRAGAWYGARKFVARHRAGVAMGAALVAAIVGAIVVVAAQNRRVARERDGAYAARDQAEAVAEFIQEMLVAADPAAGGPEASVLDVLREAAERVETDLADQPLVKASVESAIGRAYIGLGSLEEAEARIEASRAARERLLEPGHHDIAESRMDLASLRYAQGRYGEAEDLLRAALEQHRRLRGEHNLDTARVWNDLGAVLRAGGKLDEAETALRRAMAIREELSGPESVAVAESANNLSNVVAARGDFKGALSLIERVLAIRRARLKPGHAMIVQALYNVGVVRRKSGDEAGSIAAMTEAAEMSRAALGESHPERARILRALGISLAEAERHTEAEPALREALRIEEGRSPITRGWLGLCLEAAGRRDEAREHLTQALAGLDPADTRQAALRKRVEAALGAR